MAAVEFVAHWFAPAGRIGGLMGARFCEFWLGVSGVPVVILCVSRPVMP